MSEDKSQRIIDAAISEFATHGFLKGKTDRIAEGAQVSKGLIFHKFTSKKNLYSEVVAIAIKRLEQELDFETLPLNSLTELFRYSMTRKFDLAERYPREIQLLIDAYSQMAHFPPELSATISTYIEESRKQSYQIVADVIGNTPMHEGIKKADVVDLVIMAFNQTELEARALMSQEKVTDLDFMDEMIERLDTYMIILESGYKE